MKHKSFHILILAATPFEIAPLTNYLKAHWDEQVEFSFEKGKHKISILVAGIGVVATTLHLSQKLSANHYDFVLQLGIAGAYPSNDIQLADLVWVQKDCIADLGAMDKSGAFLNIAAIGLKEQSAENFIAPQVPDNILPLFEDIKPAQGLTVNCIQGNPQWYQYFQFENQAQTVFVESMEGAALHYVCGQYQIPFAQMRSISNWVEPRDKSRWKMQEAIEVLNHWAINLVKKLA